MTSKFEERQRQRLAAITAERQVLRENLADAELHNRLADATRFNRDISALDAEALAIRKAIDRFGQSRIPQTAPKKRGRSVHGLV